ncbi:MAG TPA: alpha/beta hydrolase [Jatrophihabitantaceae bacterium]
MKRAKPANLDATIRAAELAAYSHYGLSPVEKIVPIASPLGPVDVRLVIFGLRDSAQPPVLLLHGIASVNVIAAPIVAAFTDRQVIAVDWPGHGLSGPSVLPPGWAFRSYTISVLRTLLDELELDEVDIIGHSMGAQFGLYAGLDLPTRVRRLALLGAPGTGFAGVRPTPIMIALAVPGLGARLLRLPMSPAAFVRNNEKALGKAALRDMPAELVTAAHLMGSRPGFAPSIASYFRALIRRTTTRVAVNVSPAELATLRQPVLLAWGDQDVFMRPTQAAEHIAAIPQADLVELPGAGHAPWLQHPETVARAVTDHLAKPPERGPS